MSFDPQELEEDEEDEIENENSSGNEEYLTHINPTDAWFNFRNSLAHQMFSDREVCIRSLIYALFFKLNFMTICDFAKTSCVMVVALSYI